MKKTTSDNQLVASGQLLVADFQSALVNQETAATAKLEAERSEQLAVESITYNSPGTNQVFITPRDIPEETQAAVAQASVDAHMKKVQAEQIAHYSAAQIDQMEQEDLAKYKGKKVTINVLDASAQPIETFWFNNKTGEQNQTIYKKSTIKGVIDDINLRNNLLILKPTMFSKVVLPSRKAFLVYVINPYTLSPAVSLQLG